MLTTLQQPKSNPLLDPFIEAGYRGYTIRGTAHRHGSSLYRPSVEIRYNYDGSEGVFFESASQDSFFGADPALEWAMTKGREMVDGFLKIQTRRQRPWFEREHSR